MTDRQTSHQELSEQLAQVHVVIELSIQRARHETETGLPGVPVLDACLHGNALLLGHDVFPFVDEILVYHG